MNDSRFVQIHFLTSYPASLINRDDVGFAKRIPFGGAVRTRVSSQCLKRHWRRSDSEHALSSLVDDNMSIRSRRTFDKFICKPLIEDGVPGPIARAVTSELMVTILGMSEGRRAKNSEQNSGDAPEVESAQVTVLGKPEMEFLLGEVREVCKELTDSKKAREALKGRLDRERLQNLRALKMGAGLDAAMFGRMVTSDVIARCDAAVHVAHAFTVHGEAAESDYFSAVDDLLANSDSAELGSGHINTAELTSGLFYGYVVIDVPLLVSNLGDDRELAARVTDRMVRLIATVSPAAKLGSTAAHSYAHLMLVETGKSQPRTLANAFLPPVRSQPDLLANSYRALGAHLAELDAAYGRNERRFLALGPSSELGQALNETHRVPSLDDLANWVSTQIGA